MAAKRNVYEPLRRMSGLVRSLVNAAPIGLRAYLTLAGRLGYLPKY